MKAFISGGAGFVGSHLVRKLIDHSLAERVVVFDNFSSGKESYLAELDTESRLKIVHGDLKDVDAVKSDMSGSDTVFHLAVSSPASTHPAAAPVSTER